MGSVYICTHCSLEYNGESFLHQSLCLSSLYSNRNKGYMCVTLHWIDDVWHIQKTIADLNQDYIYDISMRSFPSGWPPADVPCIVPLPYASSFVFVLFEFEFEGRTARLLNYFAQAKEISQEQATQEWIGLDGPNKHEEKTGPSISSSFSARGRRTAAAAAPRPCRSGGRCRACCTRRAVIAPARW
jgi:hypothetical protein